MFRSWNGARAIAYRVRERISHDLGTAVNVQAMVFGNRDDNSGTGVGFTRNAATGENKPYGDFLINAQGEDVVAGIRNTEDLDAHGRSEFPAIHDELLAIFARLERHYQDMCDTEFTIEQGKLWMLQTRVGKRTGAAALRMAVDMTKGTGKGAERWKISREEALTSASPPTTSTRCCTRSSPAPGTVIAKGLAASPGAAVGKVYFTADDAEAAAEPGREGHPRPQRDEPRGRPRHDGRRGHPHRPRRARQPRRRRRPRLGHAGRRRRRGGARSPASRSPPATSPSHEGDSSRSTARPARSCSAQMALAAAEPPAEFDTILGWADTVRQGQAPLGVRANADTGEDATNARQLGAEGIGLCRTEHMFLPPTACPSCAG